LARCSTPLETCLGPKRPIAVELDVLLEMGMAVLNLRFRFLAYASWWST
jgi:hypothetical protein